VKGGYKLEKREYSRLLIGNAGKDYANGK